MNKYTLKILLLSTILIFSSVVNVFADTAKIINSGNNKYKKVKLTPQIYEKSNPNLSDILIKDKDGNNVPYFITGIEKTTKSQLISEENQMTLINSYTKDNEFYFDYEATQKENVDEITTSISFTTTSTNFVKEIEILGSYDNKTWEKIQNDNIFNVDGISKLEINFSKPEKYSNYRFIMSNNLEKIAFTSVTLLNRQFEVENYNYEEKINPTFTTEKVDKKTLIHVAGIKNLKLKDLTIETDSTFKRFVSISNFNIYDKEIYNLSFDDKSYKNTIINLLGQQSLSDSLTIEIENNDDEPIKIDNISINYYAEVVVFGTQHKVNQSEFYTLEFGNKEILNPPIYDISSYKNEILKGEIDQLQLSQIEQEKITPPPIQKDYTTLLNGVIVGVSIVLGVIILFNLKKQ